MYCKVVFDVPLDRDFDYAVPEHLQEQVIAGVRVTAPFGPVLTTGLVVSVSQQTDLSNHIIIKEIACVLDEKPLFGADLFPLAQFMKKTWGGAIGQILFALVPPQAYFKFQPPESLPALSVPSEISLAAPSQKIFPRLKSYLNNGFHRVLLTGTDVAQQTQLAVHIAGTVLQSYGQSLITLPDVLAAQNLANRLQRKFCSEYVFCWHSKMLLSQKKKIFSRICSGFPCIVISARTGCLLPFKNLRFAAVLQEENDNYKQEENKPYFHLRDLITFRCCQHEALLIHASDTPSLEMLYAAEKSQAEKISLSQKEPCPAFDITEKKSKKSPLLSDKTLEALKKNFEIKTPSLLLLNRRGYANVYFCLNCGAYAKCKECGTFLVREKTEENGDHLICKKCGHTETLDQTCPKCQNKIFKSRGGGTQKIVSELNKLFPSARVMRLDSDTLQKKDGQGYGVRTALENGKADMIVGTRQALELLQTDKINLAVVLDADLELDSPDFRASEKFGQMLFKIKNKLALRQDGKLVIQASAPDIYPFEMLPQPYENIAQEELAARESFVYPPYVCLAKVLIKAKDPVFLEAETARVMSAGASFATEVLGPVKTGKKTDKLPKQYLLFKTTKEKYPALIAVLDQLKPSKKTDIRLFADPYDFY